MRKVLVAMMFGLLLPAVALAAGQSRFEENVAAWKPHGPVGGFEYKFALNPALFDARKASSSLERIWDAMAAAAAGHGFVMKKEGKGKVRMRTKTYFDTPDLALQKAGFVVRVNTTFKDGRPEEEVRFSVKTSGKSPEFVLGTPLKAEGVKGKVSAEDNPYADEQGRIVSRVEKGVDIKMDSAALGNLASPTLGRFARYVPDLARSGLAPETALQPVTAYSYSAKPGVVDLAGVEAEIAFEAWTRNWDKGAYVFELSLGVEKQDYYAIPQVVAAADDFFRKVVLEGLASMKMPDGEFKGSKLRLLRNP